MHPVHHSRWLHSHWVIRHMNTSVSDLLPCTMWYCINLVPISKLCVGGSDISDGRVYSPCYWEVHSSGSNQTAHFLSHILLLSRVVKLMRRRLYTFTYLLVLLSDTFYDKKKQQHTNGINKCVYNTVRFYISLNLAAS